MSRLNLTIVHDDGSMSRLNGNLVKKQKLNQHRVDILKALHQEKWRVFEAMKKTDEPDELKDLAHSVENLEFQLQEAWGFPKDRNFHYWYDVPKCLCPRMDNRENYGTKYRIINGICPVHSIETEQEKTKQSEKPS